MCLSKIVKENVKLNDEKVVYKLFFKKSDGTLNFRYIDRSIDKINAWIHEKDYREADVNHLRTISNKRYPTGFHCYTNLKEAKGDIIYETNLCTFSPGNSLVLRKCYVRGTVTMGEQCGCDVIVSKEILITGEEV
jgi:hypothetical protein